MGFGILLFGYFSILGTLPSALLFGSYAILAAFAMSLLLVYASKKLSEFNIYFKITFTVTIIFSAFLLVSIPFEILKLSDTVNVVYSAASRVARYIILLAFHNFLLQAIKKLAASVENFKIAKKAGRNLVITYIYFLFTITSFFDAPNGSFMIAAVFGGIFVFLINFILLYSCYMFITYEGYDEEIDRKFDERAEKNQNRKKK